MHMLFRAGRFGEKACTVSMVSGQNPLPRVPPHRTCFAICAHTRVAQPTCTCYSSHAPMPDDRKSNACNKISIPSFLPQLSVDEKSNDWPNDRSDSRLAQNRRSGGYYLCPPWLPPSEHARPLTSTTALVARLLVPGGPPCPCVQVPFLQHVRASLLTDSAGQLITPPLQGKPKISQIISKIIFNYKTLFGCLVELQRTARH